MATKQYQERARWQVNIARAKFIAGLKQDIDGNNFPFITAATGFYFCGALDAVLEKTTPANIQACKEWVMQHVFAHSTRAHLVAEFLVAVSKAYAIDQGDAKDQGASRARATRRRLAVLLVVSDVLHADAFHKKNYKNIAVFPGAWKPEIEELVECAAEAIHATDVENESKLKALLNFWATSECISHGFYECLRGRFADGRAAARGDAPPVKRTYKLPQVFGDENLKWHHQPASYMIEPLIQHPDRPIRPDTIIAQRPGIREASDEVRALIDEYFENIDLHYLPTGDNPTGETERYNLWYDPLGQLCKENKATGEVKTVCNGYGWSPKFCRDMQDLGLPSIIADKRAAYIEKMKLFEAERKENLKLMEAQRKEKMKLIEAQRKEENERYARAGPAVSPSSPRRRRRRFSPSSSERGSDNERSRSRSSGDDRRNRRSSRDDGRFYDRRNSFDDVQRDRQPPSQYARGSLHSNQRWNSNNHHSQTNRNSYSARGNNGSTNYTQGFPQAPQAFNNAPGFQPPPPPPMQGHFSGQPYAQSNQYFSGSQVPPPPPIYTGVYEPMANMAGHPGTNYYQGGNNPGYGNQANLNSPYNNNGTIHGKPLQHQNGFGGSYQGRGGNRGGNQGGNRGGQRGGHRGGHRGHWGNRGGY